MENCDSSNILYIETQPYLMGFSWLEKKGKFNNLIWPGGDAAESGLCKDRKRGFSFFSVALHDL